MQIFPFLKQTQSQICNQEARAHEEPGPECQRMRPRGKSERTLRPGDGATATREGNQNGRCGRATGRLCRKEAGSAWSGSSRLKDKEDGRKRPVRRLQTSTQFPEVNTVVTAMTSTDGYPRRGGGLRNASVRGAHARGRKPRKAEPRKTEEKLQRTQYAAERDFRRKQKQRAGSIPGGALQKQKPARTGARGEPQHP